MKTEELLQYRRDYPEAPEYWAETVQEEISDELAEERACDKLAEYWVRQGGTLTGWDACFPEFIILLNGGERTGLITLCDITDTWEEYGMDASDLQRLNGEIRGWIVAHSSAYGRLTR